MLESWKSRLRVGIAWLIFLGPFFYLSYGLANQWAASQTHVPSIVFTWEAHIPFIAWTIIPYWLLNVCYAGAFFLPQSRADTHVLGRRLLTAQIIAVACFVLFPLAYSFSKPDLHSLTGVAGMLFTALAGFDKPFNQAPSLHIAIVVILWPTYARILPLAARWVWHGFCSLVILSVLTTYQHHFIDIPTGALLGLFCLWLWPFEGAVSTPIAAQRPQGEHRLRRYRLAMRYALGSLGCVAFAGFYATTGWGLWSLYPAVALGFVALAYAWIGARAFQKQANGQHSLAARILFAPYTILAYANTMIWLHRRPLAVQVADGLFLGSIRAMPAPQMGVLDLCAELPFTHTPISRYCTLPWLDLVAPSPQDLSDAVQALERLYQQGDLLVCCALGYSRSATVVVAWLWITGRQDSLSAAIEQVRQVRPQLVLSAAHENAIHKCMALKPLPAYAAEGV